MFAAGTRAPSKRTSPNSLVTPLIIRSGRRSTPGWSIGTREGRDALVLGDVVVGAGEHHAPVGVVGVARPHLVAGDDVLVAVPVGTGAQRREVGAGVGLAEALAPAVAPVDDAGQEPAARCRRCRARGCPARGSRDSGAGVRRRRRARRRRSRRRWSAARGRRSRRPREPEEAGVVERPVPRRLPAPVVVVGGRRRQSRIVRRQPGAEPRAGTPPPPARQRSPSPSPMPW